MYKELVNELFMAKVLKKSNDTSFDIKELSSFLLKNSIMSFEQNPLIFDFVTQIKNDEIDMETLGPVAFVMGVNVEDKAKDFIIKNRKNNEFVKGMYEYTQNVTQILKHEYNAESHSILNDLLIETETEIVDLLDMPKIRKKNKEMIIHMREEIYHQTMLKKSRE